MDFWSYYKVAEFHDALAMDAVVLVHYAFLQSLHVSRGGSPSRSAWRWIKRLIRPSRHSWQPGKLSSVHVPFEHCARNSVGDGGVAV
jgi:hypothetical protein